MRYCKETEEGLREESGDAFSAKAVFKRQRAEAEDERACLALYNIGKIALIIGLFALVLYYLGAFRVLEPYIYCRFKRAVGLYCPGCGGTRAIKELLSGHFLRSLYYHPAVLYFLLFYVVFMARMFYSLHCGPRIRSRETPLINPSADNSKAEAEVLGPPEGSTRDKGPARHKGIARHKSPAQHKDPAWHKEPARHKGSAWRKDSITRVSYKRFMFFLYLGIAIIFIQWIVKNILLICQGRIV